MTFKVPTITGQTFISQALSSGDIGKFVEAGLPNITGKSVPDLDTADTVGGNFEGALYRLNTGQKGAASQDYLTNVVFGFGFDASRSNSIYGKSQTVTPLHIQYPILVCVANVQIPVSEAQYQGFIDNLTNKVDLDGSNATFTNLSQTAKDNINSQSNLDWTRLQEITSLSTFTCPSDGYLRLWVNNGYNYIGYKSNLDNSGLDYTYILAVNAGQNIAQYRVDEGEILTKSAASGTYKAFFAPLKGSTVIS